MFITPSRNRTRQTHEPNYTNKWQILPFCHEIDDELHYFAHCSNNKNLRQSLFNDLSKLYNGFQYLSATGKLSFVMSSDDETVLCMIGKFIHLSCETRENSGYNITYCQSFINCVACTTCMLMEIVCLNDWYIF